MRIAKSTRKDKKLMAIFDNPYQIIHFGQAGASDYTQHKDIARKMRYLRRHELREDWNNPRTPGALSRWILWGPSTDIYENIDYFIRRFDL